MFLAKQEHEGPPGVENPFSALGNPQGGRDAGDQGDLKVQSQAYSVRSTHIWL